MPTEDYWNNDYMVELTGGPKDGKRIEFPLQGKFGYFERRRTCTNNNHDEVRIHIYAPDGSYFGFSPWCPDVETAAQYVDQD